jgi:hypothetical protein
MTSRTGTGRQIPLRVAGTIIGSSLSALAASVVYWIDNDGLAGFVAIGVPVGAVIGFMEAPEAVRTSNPGLLALKLSVWAALVGFAIYVVDPALWAISHAAGFDLRAIPLVLLVLVVAAMCALSIGYPVSLPISIASVALGRWLYRRGPVVMSFGLAILFVVSSISAGLAFAAAKREEARQIAGITSSVSRMLADGPIPTESRMKETLC